MINLLPPKEQEVLLGAKKKKLVILLGVISLVSLILLCLILLSLKFYILENIRYNQSIAGVFDGPPQDQRSISLKSDIQKYSRIFSSLDVFYKKEILLSDALAVVLEVSRPQGLYFTGMSAERLKDGTVSIAISGFSDTRENVLTFKKAIEQDVDIKSSYFPPDSWIKPTDVTFYVTLQVVKSSPVK